MSCNPGQFLYEQGFCIDCSSGTFNVDGGDCISCPAGTYTSGSGSTKCTDCTGNTISYGSAINCQACVNFMVHNIDHTRCVMPPSSCDGKCTCESDGNNYWVPVKGGVQTCGVDKYTTQEECEGHLEDDPCKIAIRNGIGLNPNSGCWQAEKSDGGTGAWTRYEEDLWAYKAETPGATIGPLSYATKDMCEARATYDENQLIEGKVGPLPGAYVNIQGGGMCPTSMIGVCNDPCRYRAVRWEATSYDPISGSTQTRTADEDRKIPADTPNFQLTSWPIYHNENTKLLFSGKFEPKDGDDGDWLGQEMKWDMDLTDTEDPYQSIFFGQDTHDPKSSWSQYGPYKTDAEWNEGVTNWLSGDDGLEDDGSMRSRGSYWKMRGCASESGQTYTDDSMFYNNCLECSSAQSCECSEMNAGTKDGFRVLNQGEGQNGWWGQPVGSRVSGLSRKPPSHGIWAGTPLVCQKATDTQKGGCFLEDP